MICLLLTTTYDGNMVINITITISTNSDLLVVVLNYYY